MKNYKRIRLATRIPNDYYLSVGQIYNVRDEDDKEYCIEYSDEQGHSRDFWYYKKYFQEVNNIINNNLMSDSEQKSFNDYYTPITNIFMVPVNITYHDATDMVFKWEPISFKECEETVKDGVKLEELQLAQETIRSAIAELESLQRVSDTKSPSHPSRGVLYNNRAETLRTFETLARLLGVKDL